MSSKGLVGVVGAGNVGVATATVLASWGSATLLVENDPVRFARLGANHIPFFDPELEKLLVEVAERGTLRFSRTLDDLADARVVVICVGTPPSTSGALDLRALEQAVARLAEIAAPRSGDCYQEHGPSGNDHATRAPRGDGSSGPSARLVPRVPPGGDLPRRRAPALASRRRRR